MNFICPPDLREAVAAQMSMRVMRGIIMSGEPMPLSRDDQCKTMSRRLRAAAALEQDEQRRERLITLAKGLEMQRFGHE